MSYLSRYAMYSMQKVEEPFGGNRYGWIVDTLLFLVGLIPKAGLGYLKIITNKRGYKKS